MPKSRLKGTRQLHPRKLVDGKIVEIIPKTEIIKIVIDKTTVRNFQKYFFRTYPRKSICPIDNPIPPSLNLWLNLNFYKRNMLKQSWKEFGMWLCNELGLAGMNIKQCTMTVEYFFQNRHKHDASNYSGKFIEDAFVESKFIEDDDFLHINPLIIKGSADESNSRVEYTVEYLKEK